MCRKASDICLVHREPRFVHVGVLGDVSIFPAKWKNGDCNCDPFKATGD